MPELDMLAEADWLCNAPPLSPGDTQERMLEIYRPLAELVTETLRAGERPVCIAGDCCTSLGVFAGIQRSSIHSRVLWFDAHGDFNTREISPSGFLGGMPLAMLVGRGDQTMIDALGLRPLRESQVIITEARDLDDKERTLLEMSEVLHIPDVRTLPELLPDGPLYIHFDCDIVCPEDIPAVGYPAPGGPTAEEFQAILSEIAEKNQVIAVSLASWDPRRDPNGQSRDTCMKLLHTLIK